jgi:hypothetical protein
MIETKDRLRRTPPQKKAVPMTTRPAVALIPPKSPEQHVIWRESQKKGEMAFLQFQPE